MGTPAPPSRAIRPPRAVAARASEKFAEQYAPINLERDQDLDDFVGSDSETLTMEKIQTSLNAKPRAIQAVVIAMNTPMSLKQKPRGQEQHLEHRIEPSK